MRTIARTNLSCTHCHLSEQCLPSNLLPEQLIDLESIVNQHAPLDEHQILYRHGDPFQFFYVVKSGALKTVIVSPSGDEQIVGFHLQGEFVGLDGLHSGAYASDCIALERTILCRISFLQLQNLCHKYQNLNLALLRIISKTIIEQRWTLVALAHQTAESRLASFLLKLSKRHQVRGSSGREFYLPMPMREIANYLGLAPATFSRALKKLTETEVADINQRKVHILSPRRLQSLGAVADL